MFDKEKIETRLDNMDSLPVISELSKISGVSEKDTATLLAVLGFDPARFTSIGIKPEKVSELSAGDLRLRVKMADLIISC